MEYIMTVFDFNKSRERREIIRLRNNIFCSDLIQIFWFVKIYNSWFIKTIQFSLLFGEKIKNLMKIIIN